MPQITTDDILKALSTVQDPDLKKDLVSLNMISDVNVGNVEISFTVKLTTPACPLKEKIKQDCRQAVEPIAGGRKINITMSANVTGRNEGTDLPTVKNIIAIASGKGGVGKSTLTTNLAVALANSGARVGLLDADIYGPSIPIMFNCEHETPRVVEMNGKKMMEPLEHYGVKLVSIGFLTSPESAVVWRGPMASSAFKQFINDTVWGDLDYLLIDLPPGTSDIHLTLVQSVPVTGAVIVTTPQKVAISDALKGLMMFKQAKINVPILGIVENMAYFTPEELPNNKYYIFGKHGGRDLAERYGVPFLGEIPILQNIRESADSGKPFVLQKGPLAAAFVNLAEKLAQQIAIRNANEEQTKRVRVTA